MIKSSDKCNRFSFKAIAVPDIRIRGTCNRKYSIESNDLSILSTLISKYITFHLNISLYYADISTIYLKKYFFKKNKNKQEITSLRRNKRAAYLVNLAKIQVSFPYSYLTQREGSEHHCTIVDLKADGDSVHCSKGRWHNQRKCPWVTFQHGFSKHSALIIAPPVTAFLPKPINT